MNLNDPRAREDLAMIPPEEAEEDDVDGNKVEDTDDTAIVDEVRRFLEHRIGAEADNRSAALDDLLFLSGEHWDPQDVAQREIDGRPCLTINTLPTYLHQVTNDQRQNSPSIKVHPVDDYADIETAKVFQGLIRHIEYNSNAKVAYDTAGTSAAAIGFGFLRLVTDYCSPDSFDQEIRFKRIRNPFTVYFGHSEELDGSDVKQVCITVKLLRKDFEAEYPDSQAATAYNNLPQGIGDNIREWITETEIRIAEYYKIEETPDTLIMLSDGSTWFESDGPIPADKTPMLDAKGQKKTRPTMRRRTMWRKMTGLEVLEETEIKCKWIPVFPVYGDELDIEGKVYRSGIVRNAKDPARMYDYTLTSATEEVAMRPKAPFIGAVGQFETDPAWITANRRSHAYLEYDPVDVNGTLAPPPARQPMADVPTGYMQLMMHASDNVKKTTGLFDSSLGAQGNATSGRQEIAQQRQGDLGNYHYTDNLHITIRHVGRCLVDMIPAYYDAPRTVRILGEDNTAEHVKINQPIPETPDPETGIIRKALNDLTAGTYDVTISAGPTYDTMRQEALASMVDVAGKWPKLMDVAGDKVIAAMDWPGAQEISERVKRSMPAQVLGEETDGEVIQTAQGPLPVAQAGQAIDQMFQQLQGMQDAIKKAGVLDKQNKAKELDIRSEEVEIKKYEAETERMKVDADIERANFETGGAIEQAALAAANEAVQLILHSPLDQVKSALGIPEEQETPAQEAAESPQEQQMEQQQGIEQPMDGGMGAPPNQPPPVAAPAPPEPPPQ
jgi:hypothetical protein